MKESEEPPEVLPVAFEPSSFAVSLLPSLAVRLTSLPFAVPVNHVQVWLPSQA